MPLVRLEQVLMTNIYDGRLGGTSIEGDPDSFFPEMWRWLVDRFGVRSVLDVGCGCGHAMKFFAGEGLEVFGLEGSPKVLAHHQLPDRTVLHDLVDGPWLAGRSYDLVWCCELAEHVPDEFAANVARTVAANASKVVAFCAAPPGCGGHHHVTCRLPSFWVHLLEKEGLRHDWDLGRHARSLCDAGTSRGDWNYFRRSGIILTV